MRSSGCLWDISFTSAGALTRSHRGRLRRLTYEHGQSDRRRERHERLPVNVFRQDRRALVMASFQAWSWHLRHPQCPPISRCLARSRSLAPSQRPRLLRWLQHCLSRHYYCSPPSWRQRHLRRPRYPPLSRCLARSRCLLARLRPLRKQALEARQALSFRKVCPSSRFSEFLLRCLTPSEDVRPTCARSEGSWRELIAVKRKNPYGRWTNNDIRQLLSDLSGN